MTTVRVWRPKQLGKPSVTLDLETSRFCQTHTSLARPMCDPALQIRGRGTNSLNKPSTRTLLSASSEAAVSLSPNAKIANAHVNFSASPPPAAPPAPPAPPPPFAAADGAPEAAVLVFGASGSCDRPIIAFTTPRSSLGLQKKDERQARSVPTLPVVIAKEPSYPEEVPFLAMIPPSASQAAVTGALL